MTTIRFYATRSGSGAAGLRDEPTLPGAAHWGLQGLSVSADLLPSGTVPHGRHDRLSVRMGTPGPVTLGTVEVPPDEVLAAARRAMDDRSMGSSARGDVLALIQWFEQNHPVGPGGLWCACSGTNICVACLRRAARCGGENASRARVMLRAMGESL